MVRLERAKRGGRTHGHPEARQRVRPLIQMGNLVCDQKVPRVAGARLAVRVAVRAHQAGAQVRPHVVVGLASQVVVVLRVVAAPVTPTVQASHAQRLGVMTGSPRARQRTSHGWALQSLRVETAKPPLGGR